MPGLWFKYGPAYTNILIKTYCKGAFQKDVKTQVTTEVATEKEPPGLPKQMPTKPITNITAEIVNKYIKDNTGIVTKYFSNGRTMKAQRKQMHVRSLLDNTIFKKLFYSILHIDIKHGELEETEFSFNPS